MKPVFQENISITKGDCFRASIASLFELELSQVPNFILFPDDRIDHVFNAFIWGLGYEWLGTGYPDKKKLSECPSVNGFYDACVPSLNFENANHAVLIDSSGMVVHDPSTAKNWKGVNVLETGHLKWWNLIDKQKDIK